jgi:hypothetical protein
MGHEISFFRIDILAVIPPDTQGEILYTPDPPKGLLITKGGKVWQSRRYMKK